jgi:hypothetical protein
MRTCARFSVSTSISLIISCEMTRKSQKAWTGP